MTEDYEKLRKAVNQRRDLLSKNIKVHKFYDKLRSNNVISLGDYQEIDNSLINRTDAEKASSLLDIIDTKGPIGQKVFLDTLDEHYPHLYEDVTGLESTPRTYLPSPDISASYSPVIDLDGVRHLSRRLEEEIRQHGTDQLAIRELREEVYNLRFFNATCKAKLNKYPKLLKINKQMDIEIKELKEWQLNMVHNINQLDKENTKLKFEKKEHKQLITQLVQKLNQALNIHECSKHNWEQTNCKNEQLAQDNNNLEKQLEHMQREMQTVKRQSSLWSMPGSFFVSQDKTHQDPEAVIEILRMDLEESKANCKDLMDRLYEERSDAQSKDLQYEQIRTENEELKQMLLFVQRDMDITNRNYQLTWQELQKVSAERNYAYEQRDRAQTDAQEQVRERDILHQRLNKQLMQFKHQLQNPLINANSEKNEDFITHKQLFSRDSDTSGVSSGYGNYIDDNFSTARDSDASRSNGQTSSVTENEERKSATLPRSNLRAPLLPQQSLQTLSVAQSVFSASDSVQRVIRPRAQPIMRKSPSAQRKPLPGQNPFPESEFPLSPSPSLQTSAPDFPKKEIEEDADVSQVEGLSAKDVAKGFATRPAYFADSTRSDLAIQGSKKKANYHEQVDLWNLRQSIKMRPSLMSSFSSDYDDEEDDIARIFDDDMRPATKRRSRSLDHLDSLVLSSDDSDDGANTMRRQQPLRNRNLFDFDKERRFGRRFMFW